MGINMVRPLCIVILISFSLACFGFNSSISSEAKSFAYNDNSADRNVVNLSVLQSDSSVILNWAPDPLATNYKVYSSTSPDGVFTADYSGLYAVASWTAPLTRMKQFYRVTSVQSAIPTNFVFVQGGTVADITVNSFYIDKYELTNTDWNIVMGIGGGNTAPRADVSWFDTIEYCNRRSIIEDLTPCYSYQTYGANPDNWPSWWSSNSDFGIYVNCDWTANGYRLPTEAEWEYAARGGLNTHGYFYSGSDILGTIGWYWDNSGHSAHLVGELGCNELGLYDMSGNIWEWCWDKFDINNNGYRILRGGYFNYLDYICGVSFRWRDYARLHNEYMGFRLVRKAP
jgi:formylglycine-generating enzyme